MEQLSQLMEETTQQLKQLLEAECSKLRDDLNKEMEEKLQQERSKFEHQLEDQKNTLSNVPMVQNLHQNIEGLRHELKTKEQIIKSLRKQLEELKIRKTASEPPVESSEPEPVAEAEPEPVIEYRKIKRKGEVLYLDVTHPDDPAQNVYRISEDKKTRTKVGYKDQEGYHFD